MKFVDEGDDYGQRFQNEEHADEGAGRAPVTGEASGQCLHAARARLSRARRGFSTRRADISEAEYLLTGGVVPQPGDLVLAQVTNIGQHTRIEQPDGRRAQLYVGDEIVVAYGNRYAPDQFEAEVPDDLGACHLVAAGGIASQLINKNSRMKNPTRITPIGLLADADLKPLNLKKWRVDAASVSAGPR